MDLGSGDDGEGVTGLYFVVFSTVKRDGAISS